MTKTRNFWANLSINHPLRNNKGFTMVELMITLCLMVILLMGAVNVFSSASSAFVKVQVRNEQQLLLDGMVEVIATELRFATKVTINESANGSIYSPGKDLYMAQVVSTGAALSSERYRLDLKFERLDDYTLSLDISLTDESAHITTKETTAIRLINCKLKSNELPTTPTEGKGVTYTAEDISGA